MSPLSIVVITLNEEERILFLDADVRLPFNFLANAMDSLEERKLEIAACTFSTRRVHQETGRFDEKIALCEDYDYVKRASKTWRFRMLNQTFNFDPHRFEQEGLAKTGFSYLKANVRRLFFGEVRNIQTDNKYNHHKEQQ